jgi:uncharacterized repeat protein (TIGR01451 family)
MTASNTAPTVGAEVTFTVTLTNAGPAPATGVGVGDWLPDGGLTFLSAKSSQGTYDPVTGLWRVSSLASGGTATLQLVGKATTAGAKTNTAQVNVSDQVDPDSTPGNSNPAEDDQASVTITASQPLCASATVTADADSWIGQNGSSTNHGSESALKVRSQSNANARALVHFALPTIPSGCQETAAKLRLYAASATTGRTLSAYALAAPWTETVVSWSNRPSTTGTGAIAASGAGWVQWTVTTPVTGMYTSANNGFMIRDASEGGSGIEQRFSSRESSVNLPELTVTFGPRS